jgi:hypothetical protein
MILKFMDWYRTVPTVLVTYLATVPYKKVHVHCNKPWDSAVNPELESLRFGTRSEYRTEKLAHKKKKKF